MSHSDPPRRHHQGFEDLVTEPLDDIIDPENFTPRLLALLSNALVWRESHELRRRFKLGTNDWRVISAIAMWPGASASEVSEFIAVNKAVVSKSVTVLAERKLIVLADGPRGSRPLYLTAAGAQMHHDMLPISMSGQDIILAGMTAQQTADMNAWLREMIEKVRDAALPEPVGAAAATSSAGS